MHSTEETGGLSRRAIIGIVAVVTALLAVKFFMPLFHFDMPLGYDAEIYRYLFIRHAEAFPPFWIADLEPWTREHPLGLFFFSTILLRLGVPVDWLIGWIWNMFPVALACTLAFVTRRTHGPLVALGTLLAALLSVAYFDGFAAMYWKTYASLLWCVLAFSALERRSFLSLPYGVLAIATHHQTGLLFGLTVGAWTIALCVRSMIGKKAASHAKKKRGRGASSLLLTVGTAIVIAVIGAATYLPVWKDAVLQNLPALLGQTADAAGNFPSPAFYLRTAFIVLLLGGYGFALSWRTHRWTPWQFAVLWSFAFVALRLVFYRRFFLQLDFFLLPFVGIALADLWRRFSSALGRTLIVAVVLVQLFFTHQASLPRAPLLDRSVFDAIIQADAIVPGGSLVLGLENESTAALRGRIVDVRVGGPGLFDSDWTYPLWRQFLLSEPERRREMLAKLTGPVYIFASPYFREYYAEHATAFLTDPCFAPTESPMLLRVICPTASEAQP